MRASPVGVIRRNRHRPRATLTDDDPRVMWKRTETIEERRLLAAVMEMAFRDLADATPKIKRETIRWFRSNASGFSESDGVTFLSCCEILNIKYHILRKQAEKIYRRPTSC